METHTIKGGGGLGLHVRSWGSPRGIPLLFIHGWSQSHLCWVQQYESAVLQEFRMIALDLRGHGMSEAPSAPGQYSDGDLWAEDIAAIMGQLALVRPVLVGWSYGGVIISDYVRKYGDSKLGGVNFVAAAVVIGPKAFGTLIGPGFLNHAPGACQPDLPTSIAAIRNLLRACIVKPVSQDIQETALAYNMVVRPEVRGALIQRELDFSPVLDGLNTPVLVTHGRSDSVVLPAMSEHILRHCRKATASWFDDVGHCPFLEEPERFNRELARFAERANRSHG